MRSMRFFTSALLLTLGTSLSYASGFILNEQSLNGTALNSAYVAGAYGADSSYYNPANMGFDDNNELELNATMIFIPGFDFTTNSRDAGLNFGGTQQNPDRRNTIVDGKAHSTLAFVPKMFFKTKALEVNEVLKSSFGLSVTTPSGLTMDWGKEGGEFMDNVGIAMIEINPVMALTYFNRFSLGGAEIYLR
nr:outer membrane protein transport protein [uncultured Helicobacter sp.]